MYCLSPLSSSLSLLCLSAGISPNFALNLLPTFSLPMNEEKTRSRKRAPIRVCNGVGDKTRKNEPEAACNVVDDIEDFSVEAVLKIRVSLLQWYYDNQRTLPWRINQCEENEVGGGGVEEEVRAYAVWVSEVMLQQTQVVKVINYYKRWMEKWPTVHHLAGASIEEVNEMWAGLGYYRRARYLLEGAKSIVKEGEFPKTASTLRSVQGIGNYTAGAIASIAFKEVVPVVDGNVVRVIARLKAISTNPKESTTVQRFWKLAGQLVDHSKPGDFNQALMELGATLCTLVNPTCSTCPISDQCQAFTVSRKTESIQVTDYPMKVVKAKQRHEFAAVCVVEITEDLDLKTWKTKHSKSNVFLLVKRPEEGLLAGLWEFPLVLVAGEDDSRMRRQAMDQYLEDSFKVDVEKNGKVLLREDVGEYVHVFSHIRLRMYVELLVLYLKGGSKILSSKEDQITVVWKCADDNSIEGMGLTSGVRKVYNMITSFKQNGRVISPTKARKRRK